MDNQPTASIRRSRWGGWLETSGVNQSAQHIPQITAFVQIELGKAGMQESEPS